MFKAVFFGASFAVLSCLVGCERKSPPETPGTNVDVEVDRDKLPQSEIHAPGVDVKVTPEEKEIRAPGVDIQIDRNGPGDRKVDVDVAPAG